MSRMDECLKVLHEHLHSICDEQEGKVKRITIHWADNDFFAFIETDVGIDILNYTGTNKLVYTYLDTETMSCLKEVIDNAKL